MAIKPIITEPNKILRQISIEVESVGKEEQKLMDDMLDTMYDANGIGFCYSNWRSKRIIVMDIAKNEKKKTFIFCKSSNQKNKNSNFPHMKKGCLSVPNYFAEIDRPKNVMLRYLRL